MPITEFQRSVLRLLSSNRGVESHVAGGLVLNAGDDTPRFSRDVDIFHDVPEAMRKASEDDVCLLEANGYSVEKIGKAWSEEEVFRNAMIRTGEGEVKIDWVSDSAVRFFPIVDDDLMGWRLHWFDVAVNKVLALSARSVSRDYVEAEAELIALADEEPDLPIGVAFVNSKGEPGWYRDDRSQSLHRISTKGCWPQIS